MEKRVRPPLGWRRGEEEGEGEGLFVQERRQFHRRLHDFAVGGLGTPLPCRREDARADRQQAPLLVSDCQRARGYQEAQSGIVAHARAVQELLQRGAPTRPTRRTARERQPARPPPPFNAVGRPRTRTVA